MIEAARAVEARWGFAVVAQEVGRQFSDMQAATNESGSAIKQIGSTIGRNSEITGAPLRSSSRVLRPKKRPQYPTGGERHCRDCNRYHRCPPRRLRHLLAAGRRDD